MNPFVALAQAAVEEYVRNRRVTAPPAELPPEMQTKAGVFVCVKNSGELRGCIGTILPCTPNLYCEIVRNAIAAVKDDPRFPPVHPDELAHLTYMVDVLSEPEKVQSLSELDPRKYGVIVTKGHQRGLLLPDLEGVDTVEEQLRITKIKAFIDPADDKVEIARFHVQRYT